MLGQHRANVAVVPYHPGWQELFDREAELLRGALGESAMRIEHVGSTAIPGMVSKPILDIMVAVESLAQGAKLIPLVESLGYEYRIPDIVPERLYFVKGPPEMRTHHLNLTPRESWFWRNHLLFRDYLRTHDQAAAEYAALKERLADRFAHQRQQYTDGKSEFIARILKLAENEKRSSS